MVLFLHRSGVFIGALEVSARSQNAPEGLFQHIEGRSKKNIFYMLKFSDRIWFILMRPAIVGQCESRGTYFTFNQAVHSFLGQKGQKTFFFSVFEAELAHAESPGPYNLQAILSSDIKTDSSLKCVIFDPGGATGLIRRDPVNCVPFRR